MPFKGTHSCLLLNFLCLGKTAFDAKFRMAEAAAKGPHNEP